MPVDDHFVFAPVVTDSCPSIRSSATSLDVAGAALRVDWSMALELLSVVLWPEYFHALYCSCDTGSELCITRDLAIQRPQR